MENSKETCKPVGDKDNLKKKEDHKITIDVNLKEDSGYKVITYPRVDWSKLRWAYQNL